MSSVGGAGNGPRFQMISGGAGQGVPAPSGPWSNRPAVPLPEDDASIRARVRLAAGASQSFESALLSMVEATGVAGQRAQAVTEAIMANDELRNQAQRAYDGSGIGLA